MNFLKFLSVTDRYSKMYLDRHLATLGINSSQHMYILKICREPGITQDQFINDFYIHPSNITRSISFLERAGFLRREPHEKDKRTYCLYPTSKAIDANETILSLLMQCYDTILEDFSENEKEVLTNLLEKACNNSVTKLLNSPL